MARCAAKAAAVSHWNSSHSNLHLLTESENSDFAHKLKMTNADYAAGDNPEAAKKFLQGIIKRVDDLRAIVITDRDGIPIIKVTAPDIPDPVSKPNFLASVSLAVEQAGKLGNGTTRRIICVFNTIQVIHFNKSPLMISLIASSKANTGLLLNLESELNNFVEDLRTAISEP
ncbi:hypothetical protein JTE90_027462 [Oedothorax gibbosus]|uniref:Ragulator complex protein LAMTOR3 n=1 Tax=Oedothorax gibbosus TaxID=931172 RepID=A0AAV6W3A4_9ARAC|nr:hypothetical protein JTE90_027462 [Oedothorax gibbosus]